MYFALAAVAAFICGYLLDISITASVFAGLISLILIVIECLEELHE